MKLEDWHILQLAPNIKSQNHVDAIRIARPSDARLMQINSLIEKIPAPAFSFSIGYARCLTMSFIARTPDIGFSVFIGFLSNEMVSVGALGDATILTAPTTEQIIEKVAEKSKGRFGATL